MDRITGHFRRFAGCMHVKPGGAHCSEKRFSAINFRCGAVSHQQKAVGLQGGLVLDHAVFRHTNAKERCTERTQAPDNDRVLDGRDHYRGQIAKHAHISNDGNGDEQSAEEQAPKAAPNAPCLPQNLTRSPTL
jgi:hypothetical protein